MNSKDIIERLKKSYNKKNVEGMARFGITPKKTYGVPKPELRGLGKEIGKDHKVAIELWSSGILDARIVAFDVFS